MNSVSSGKAERDSFLNTGAWQCVKCTFENEPLMTYCEVCESPKSEDSNKSNNATSNGTPKEWKCDVCTHENKMSINICRNCGSGRPAKFNVSPVNCLGPKTVKRPIGAGWECTQCFEVNNEWQSYCNGCFQPKEDTSKKLKVEKEPAGWSCSKCTVKNDETKTVCECCFQSRILSETTSPNPSNTAVNTSSSIIDPSSLINSNKDTNNSNQRRDSNGLGAWSCGNCTLENPASSEKCDICHTEKPIDVPENVDELVIIHENFTEIRNNMENEKRLLHLSKTKLAQKTSIQDSQMTENEIQTISSESSEMQKKVPETSDHDNTMLKSCFDSKGEEMSPELAKLNEKNLQKFNDKKVDEEKAAKEIPREEEMETESSATTQGKNTINAVTEDDDKRYNSLPSTSQKENSPQTTTINDIVRKENLETESLNDIVEIKASETFTANNHQDVIPTISTEEDVIMPTTSKDEVIVPTILNDENNGESSVPSPVATTSFSSDIQPSTSPLSRQSRKYKELRVVLVGRTGAGKSLLANNILNGKYFKSKAGAASVTKTCCMEKSVRYGKRITIVDTPGLFDTDMTEEEVKKEIAKCVGLSAPGPHAIVLVIRADRFTEEELQTIVKIKDMFGEIAMKHMIIMFTRRDDLDRDNSTIDDMIEESGTALKDLRDSCNGRYMAIDNRARPGAMGEQVRKFISVVEQLIADNNGMYYSNEMYEMAECFIQHREEEIKKALQAEKLKQLEKLEREFTEKLKEKENEHRLIISQMKGRIDELEKEKDSQKENNFENETSSISDIFENSSVVDETSETKDILLNDTTTTTEDTFTTLPPDSESSGEEAEIKPGKDIMPSSSDRLNRIIFHPQNNDENSQSSYGTAASDNDTASTSESTELKQQVNRMEESHRTEVGEMQERFESEQQRTSQQFDDIDVREQVQRDVEVEEEETANNLSNSVWNFGRSVFRGARSLFWR